MTFFASPREQGEAGFHAQQIIRVRGVAPSSALRLRLILPTSQMDPRHGPRGPRQPHRYFAWGCFSVLAWRAVRDLKLDRAKVNVNGGSFALGHPIGATGLI